jgi:hypothetical protein
VSAKSLNIPMLYAQLNIDVKINNLTVFEDSVNMDDIPTLKEDIKNYRIIESLQKELETHKQYLNQFTNGYKCFDDWRKENKF